MKKLIALAACLLMLAALPSIIHKTAAAAAPKGSGEGMSIESFTTTDLDGNAVDSSIFSEAKLTVINYWATWCPPCKREMPDFSELHKHYTETPEKDVQLIGVICEGGGCTPASARQYLAENGFEWRNLRSAPELDKVFFTSESIPQTLIVDGTGKVLAHKIGMFASYDQLESYVESYLKGSAEPAASAQPEPAPRASSCSGF